MMSLADIGARLEDVIAGRGTQASPTELLGAGEDVLKHWVVAKGLEPTTGEREGFRLLALHRQGAQGDLSFNACRETARELVYHFNLLTLQPDHPDSARRLTMMALVTNHLYLFIAGKMETQQLGEFCCSSKPLHAV
ncbi:MAG: hypothetical protein ACR2QG_06625 [Gammaproteobacteria bacterium]